MDWNNDGQMDLVTGEYIGYVRVYLRDGAALNDPTRVKVGGADFRAGYSKPEVTDWNNDGLKDLIVGDGDGRIHLLLNSGTDAAPAFASDALIQGDGADLTVISRASPVVADWNRDGRKDLVVGSYDGKVYLFANIGTDAEPQFHASGAALKAADKTINLSFYSRPEVVDWNNDGIPDLLSGFEDFDDKAQAVMYFRGREPAMPAPEIKVMIGTTKKVEVRDGQAKAISFGSVRKGAKAPVRSFWVYNIGKAPLTLGTVSVPAGYRVVDKLVSRLGPGKYDVFKVSLNTTKIGRFAGSISFANNDANENPFNFKVVGQVGAKTAASPAIAFPATVDSPFMPRVGLFASRDLFSVLAELLSSGS